METPESAPPQRRHLVSLGAALVLSALGTPILRALVQRGGHFASGSLENAISYCNVLFVGNLCSALIVALFFRPWNMVATLRRMSLRRWLAMLANTALANVLAPMLLIKALDQESTDITAIILLLQTECVFLALSCAWFFGDRLTRWTLAGLSLIALGVMALALLPGMPPVGTGHAYVLAAALFRSLGTIMARECLTDQDELPTFLIFRNLVGAIVFYILAVSMFGPGHFQDAFLPSLWPLMLVYAGLVVVLGQLSWYHAVANLPGAIVSQATTLVPIASMVFAYLLLGSQPSTPQWLSVALFVAGLAVTQLGRDTQRHSDPDDALDRPFTGG